MAQPIIKDDFFFFENVHIKVEDTLFCIPKVGLNRPGTTFGDMFSLPVEQKDAEGSSEENPIVLQVGKVDFRTFLTVLYSLPQSWGPGLPKTVESWVGVLDLSTMWRFTEVRAQAIAALTKLLQGFPPAKRITLGKKFKVKTWVETGYTALVTADLPFDHRELFQLGIDYPNICDLLSVRQAILMMDPSNFSDSVTSSPQQEGECPCCREYYYSRPSQAWGGGATTNWFIVGGETICDACYQRSRKNSSTQVGKKFPYAQVAEKKGPGLISSTFKEEFEALDKFERDL